MFDLKNAKYEDFEVVENKTSKCKKGKVFVPFCRVKRGFERRKHEVSDMPQEIYALFRTKDESKN